MKYDELVKALRNCAEMSGSCSKCRYKHTDPCKWTMMHDAAAAIEELQQIADHHEQTAKDYWKEACDYKARLSKQGEWIFDGKFMELHRFHCSNCKRTEFRMSDYCPNCGADMRKMEVNNG